MSEELKETGSPTGSGTEGIQQKISGTPGRAMWAVLRVGISLKSNGSSEMWAQWDGIIRNLRPEVA